MYSIIGVEKHSSIGSLKSREAHTYRTRPTANANPAKKHLNKLIFGRLDYAETCAEKLEAYSKTKNIRANAVYAIEYLLTASPEFFDDVPIYDQQKNLNAWCEVQLNYLKETHGEENILCAYLHLDEKTPHIEAFVLPIDKKGNLNCRSFLGGSKKLAEMHTNYAKHNAHFGLKRGMEGSIATHQKVKHHYDAINKKSEINDKALAQALKLDKPSITDKLKMEDYLATQEKQLRERITKMFMPVVQKAKLAERAEKLVGADKKREEKMNAEKLMLEKQAKQLQKDAALRNAPLRMVEILQEEVAEQKKTIDWYEQKFDEMKAKTIRPKTAELARGAT